MDRETEFSNFSSSREQIPRGFGQVHSSYDAHGWGRGGSYDHFQRAQFYPHNEFGRGGDGGGRYPNFRRGKGRSVGGNLSAGSRPSGGSRKCWKERISAEERPDLFYDKEMLEDPWKGMTPVVWDGPPPVKSSQLPKSVSVKKARTSSDDSRKSMSQPSLAELLASSFNENIDEPEA
ncbi:protein SICKLE-like [Henckelia pumila]|uniref:protein SICKLE-like n=1 Tax=Henckelia pumila TaxID=405737 RepID=UPI003C6E78A3